MEKIYIKDEQRAEFVSALASVYIREMHNKAHRETMGDLFDNMGLEFRSNYVVFYVPTEDERYGRDYLRFTTDDACIDDEFFVMAFNRITKWMNETLHLSLPMIVENRTFEYEPSQLDDDENFG